MPSKIEVKTTSTIINNSNNLFLKLKKLNNLFSNIPFEDKIKRKLIQDKLKFKSAWYATLVNPLIEINLIPEYLQSENCTNLLLKKETETYYKSVAGFSWLKDNNDVELFENILIDDNKKVKTDLFNVTSSTTYNCHKELSDFFIEFNTNHQHLDDISKILFLFFNWHKNNNFNFENQHQIILWLNYKLFEAIGQATYLLPIEDFLYHQCQKSGREIPLLISDFFKFLALETEKLLSELKNEFQKNINFEILNTKQRIVSMHLFNSSFETNFESQITKNRNLKMLFQKGFLCFDNKFEYEIIDSKTLSQLKYLFENKAINIEIDRNKLYFYIKTDLNIDQKWLYYKNINIIENKEGYDEIIQNYLSSNIKTTPINSLETIEKEFEIKKKAFFG